MIQKKRWQSYLIRVYKTNNSMLLLSNSLV